MHACLRGDEVRAAPRNVLERLVDQCEAVAIPVIDHLSMDSAAARFAYADTDCDATDGWIRVVGPADRVGRTLTPWPQDLPKCAPVDSASWGEGLIQLTQTIVASIELAPILRLF